MNQRQSSIALLHACCVVIAGFTALTSAAVAAPSVAVRAGELIVEPPTLISLGFEWEIDGDDNRNAAVTVAYRREGTESGTQGLPLLRLQQRS